MWWMMNEVLCYQSRGHFHTKFCTVNELTPNQWGSPFGVLFARRASPCSPLSTLPEAVSTVLASSAGEACCFEFFVFKLSVSVSSAYSYGLSQPKNGQCFRELLRHDFLRVRTWKLEALTLKQHCTWKKNYTKKSKLLLPTRYRRDIRQNSKKRQLFHTNSYKNRRSRSKWNFLGRMLKAQGEHRYKFQCPIRHPSRDITKTRFHIYVQWFTKKIRKKLHFCDAPLNFAILDLKFYPRKWTACANKLKAGLLFYF